MKGTHIGGAKAGEIGTSELFDIARQYGREQGAKKIIIEGGKRSSGKMKGKVPRPITINLE